MVLAPGRWVRTERADLAHAQTVVGGHHVGSVVAPSAAVFEISAVVAALALAIFALAGLERRWRTWGWS